jgi:hypothetical protein
VAMAGWHWCMCGSKVNKVTTIERVNEIKANTHKWINKENAKTRARIKAKAKADLTTKREGTWE